MAENSKIEWTHHTYNPWWGCVKVSEGCANCYAERDSKRYGFSIWGPNSERRFFGEKHWNGPLKWNRDAERAGERRRVFCASMADVFEGREDLDEARYRLFELIEQTPALDWLLLTKRPENIWRLLTPAWQHGDMPDNVWLGTSCENQEQADTRIPHLLRGPAAVRFLSCEPLLGPITLRDEWRLPRFAADDGRYYQANGRGVDWVIVGGESGPKARPMHPDWARSLRDQCASVGVAFHFKQWGEWSPSVANVDASRIAVLTPNGRQAHPAHDWSDYPAMYRVGKKAAGRLLDGREWNEFPQAQVIA